MAAGKSNDDQRRSLRGTVVTYDAKVKIVGRLQAGQPLSPERPGATELDSAVAERLWADQDLRSRLHDEAQRLFGEEFRAHVLDVEAGDSVHVIVELHAERLAAVVVVDFRRRAALFGERVRLTLASACRHAGYEVLIAVESQGAVLVDEPGKNAVEKKPWDRVGAVLAAVATGIGVLGFVAFVGGAIEFGRLEKAGLPAEEAIALVPNANLISTGARVLVPALVFALGTAMLLTAAQLAVEPYYRRLARRRDLGIAIYAPGGEHGGIVQGTVAPQLRQALIDPGSRAVALAAIFAALEVVVLATAEPVNGFWPWLMVGLIALTGAAVFVIARRSRSFIWVAAATFVAGALFWTTLEYAQTKAELKVRPAAAIRQGNPITGFFVAETSSQIYFGRTLIPPRIPAGDLGPGSVPDAVPRILVLSKDEVNDFAIGPLMNPRKAYLRARHLARELCYDADDTPLKLVASEKPRRRSECDRILLQAGPQTKHGGLGQGGGSNQSRG